MKKIIVYFFSVNTYGFSTFEDLKMAYGRFHICKSWSFDVLNQHEILVHDFHKIPYHSNHIHAKGKEKI